MRIAICDDDRDERILLANHLRSVMSKRRLDCEIEAFADGGELLARRQACPFDIYFLDIYMTDVTGMEAAFEIREAEPDACIAFITSSTAHMSEGFEVGAVHYVLKPIAAAAVDEAVSRCLRILGKQEKYITLSVERLPQKVLLSEILVVESSDKYCRLTTKDGVIKSYVRLDEVETMMDDARFLRCHRSYLINMDYAKGVVDGLFEMIDGTRVPIKRDKRVEMKKLFNTYCFDELRKKM